MKRFLIFSLILVSFIKIGVSPVTAATAQTESDFFSENNYSLLQPLPDAGGDGSISEVDVSNFPTYVNNMFLLLVGLGGVLAVLYISYGGLVYMTTDAVTQKQEGIKIVKRALWGLIIIIGCFLILKTINPTILDLSALSRASSDAKVTGGSNTGTTGNGDWCINVTKEGRAFQNDCGSQETCSSRANYWNRHYYYVGSGFTSNLCKTSSGALADQQWCFNIFAKDPNSGSVSAAIRQICTGKVYQINPNAYETCHAKMTSYPTSKYKVDKTKDCYVNNDKLCFDVYNNDGTPYKIGSNADCLTQYLQPNTINKQSCDAEASSWNLKKPGPYAAGQCTQKN